MAQEEKPTAEIIKPFGEYRTPGVSKDIIDLIERVLARAEAGEVAGVAITFITPNGHTCSEVAFGSAGYAAMAGATVALQSTILQQWRET